MPKKKQVPMPAKKKEMMHKMPSGMPMKDSAMKKMMSMPKPMSKKRK